MGVSGCCRQVCLDLCSLCVLCRCVGVHQRLDCGSVTLCRGQGAAAVVHTQVQSATANAWGDMSVCMAEYACCQSTPQCMDMCVVDLCPCLYVCPCFCVHQCVLWECVRVHSTSVCFWGVLTSVCTCRKDKAAQFSRARLCACKTVACGEAVPYPKSPGR